MTCTVDRLDAESLSTTTKIGHSDRSIGLLRCWEIVRWFELARCHPVDTRSLHIDGREMDDTCELSGREEGTILGKSLRNLAIYNSPRPRECEVSTLRTRVYRECSTRVPCRARTTCTDDHTHGIAIIIELGF